jgi:Holliday junction resolvasome RuvABC endonuclease subunit
VSRFVVGIDPSLTRTGITLLTVGGDGVARPKVLRECGYHCVDSPGFDASSDRIVSQARTVAAIIDKLAARPELVMVEAMIPPRDALPSYLERAALWYGIWSAIKARGLPRAVIQPTTLKKWATGAGRADKELVLAEVRNWWPDIPIANHDIADSAVCAAAAAMRLGWTMPFPTRRRHVEGLTTVRWPSHPCAKPEPAQVNA